MSAKVQEIMSILTPPPSELDDCDMNRLLTCSPALSHFCYPSPTPSYRTFCADMQSTKDNNNLAGAGTTNSFFTQEELPYAVEDNGSQQMFFNTNTNSGFYQTSLNSSERAALYDATLDMPLDDSLSEYQAYDQSHWMTYSSYEGVQPMMAYSTDTINTPFPLLDTSHPPTATNLIPPTPQTTIQTPFNFDAAPNQYSSSHLSTTPSYPQLPSQHSVRSLSSLSRSCSPIPASYDHFNASHQTPSPVPSSSGLQPRPALRSDSTSSSTSLHAYGITVPSADPTTQAWRCAYPGCTSRATFIRGCDLRKHYNRHSKHLFCRVDGCPQSQAAAEAAARPQIDGVLTGGFSSKKDRARHEAKHNPGIRCEWKGPEGEECGRVFSRMDNMKDHVRRIHKKVPGNQ